ncbi:FliM/FliN family flagellar motor switch protein [Hyphomonas johnsonii]|uniref:Flagellar motor switch protein FliN n=1 Tax=Hyphomonas johnsonii MHS-2 TaxID=1280950 RepID=A0A059FNW1_9PROT|nr:FliM/FliN family flagellar motor switch protein [Hyphomonas johnsonii]KCZ92211.1 putative flagellar motor switch protein FliN [Hyphomonas johnsonii MHS-2]
MANPEESLPPTVEVDRREPSGSNKYRRSIFSVPVTVTVSIGQARLSVSEILELRTESVVPLTSRIDDPVDLTIDNKVIARGELVETDDGCLGVKITEIPEQAQDAIG